MIKHFWLVLCCLLVLSIPVFGLEQAKTVEYEAMLLNDTGLFDPVKLVKAITKLEPTLGKQMTNDKRETDYLSLIRLGIYYHNLAANGSQTGYRGYSKKAYEALSKAVGDPLIPDELQPIARAYLGSSRALMGSESSNPINKIMYVQEGITILNEAVAKFPRVSYFPLFMRENVLFVLPKFFNKEEEAFQDCLQLVEWNKTDSSRIPKPVMAQVDYNLGNCYKNRNKLDTAIEYWKLAYSLAPESPAGVKSLAMLKAFEAAYVQ